MKTVLILIFALSFATNAMSQTKDLKLQKVSTQKDGKTVVYIVIPALDNYYEKEEVLDLVMRYERGGIYERRKIKFQSLAIEQRLLDELDSNGISKIIMTSARCQTIMYIDDSTIERATIECGDIQ